MTRPSQRIHTPTPPRRSRHRTRRVGAVVVTGLLLAVGSLASASLSVAAPRPKTGPCVVSAGVTYSVRNTVVTGTTGEDTIDCSASRKSMTIIGRGGGDDITGSKGGDVIYGDGSTTPNGSCADFSVGEDRLDGGPGDDTIRGSVCGSSARGGTGNDRFTAGGGDNSVQGGDGDDIIDLRNAEPGAYAEGGLGNDSITGPQGGMYGNGNEGNDIVIGGAGNDDLVGMDGDDSLDGGGGNDALNGGPGIDQLAGGDGDDNLLDSSPEADFFIGGLNATTVPPLPRPGPGQSGAWGDVCLDGDGQGKSPDDPDGMPSVGVVSPIQNDTLGGCEYLIVFPSA